MNKFTTDNPNGNLETMLNFAYAKNGDVWLRGADDGKDVELCAYIAKRAFYLELCGITNKDDVVEACGSADCFCELGALFAAATQAAELRARLAAYEDTGLEPEEVEACKLALMGKSLAEVKEIEGISVERMKELAKAEAEGRLVVLDRETALAIAAGYIAVKKLNGANFVYDPLGEDGGPYEIPYLKAGEILCNIWDKYPLEGEDAEKALEGMNNDER